MPNHFRHAASRKHQVRATENISGVDKSRGARGNDCEALSRGERHDLGGLSENDFIVAAKIDAFNG